MVDRPSPPMTSDWAVARQLDAYNARDLEAFMSCWRSDAQLIGFPDVLLAAGTDEIRLRQAVRFAQPHLWAELVSRHVAGQIISDHEIVTRTVDGEAQMVAVIAIYEVDEGGLIRTAYFAEGPLRAIAP